MAASGSGRWQGRRRRRRRWRRPLAKLTCGALRPLCSSAAASACTWDPKAAVRGPQGGKQLWAVDGSSQAPGQHSVR